MTNDIYMRMEIISSIKRDGYFALKQSDYVELISSHKSIYISID